MIDLSYIVLVVVNILIAGAVLALLYFLIEFVAKQFPGEPMAMFAKFARIALVILAVLVLIGILLSFANGTPLFSWGPWRK